MLHPTISASFFVYILGVVILFAPLVALAVFSFINYPDDCYNVNANHYSELPQDIILDLKLADI